MIFFVVVIVYGYGFGEYYFIESDWMWLEMLGILFYV